MKKIKILEHLSINEIDAIKSIHVYLYWIKNTCLKSDEEIYIRKNNFEKNMHYLNDNGLQKQIKILQEFDFDVHYYENDVRKKEIKIVEKQLILNSNGSIKYEYFLNGLYSHNMKIHDVWKEDYMI